MFHDAESYIIGSAVRVGKASSIIYSGVNLVAECLLPETESTACSIMCEEVEQINRPHVTVLFVVPYTSHALTALF